MPCLRTRASITASPDSPSSSTNSRTRCAMSCRRPTRASGPTSAASRTVRSRRPSSRSIASKRCSARGAATWRRAVSSTSRSGFGRRPRSPQPRASKRKSGSLQANTGPRKKPQAASKRSSRVHFQSCGDFSIHPIHHPPHINFIYTFPKPSFAVRSPCICFVSFLNAS